MLGIGRLQMHWQWIVDLRRNALLPQAFGDCVAIGQLDGVLRLDAVGIVHLHRGFHQITQPFGIALRHQAAQADFILENRQLG